VGWKSSIGGKTHKIHGGLRMTVDGMTFGTDVTLHTERLTLRPFGETDVEAVMAAAADPEMRRWMPWAERQTPEQAITWCTALAHEDPEHRVNFAIVPRGGHCAGSVGLGRAAWEGGRVEIGYWVAPWARRRGYAVEAVRAVTALAFDRGLHRVELLAATGNLASQAVAAKAGFTREGVLREAVLVPGGRSDAVLFSLLAGDAG
jgi:RimJ/RimL family protein N-acetyltransferase